MNEPKVSVIIPVYSSEKTLCGCVDSILSQSLADIEAIFVDDHSTDGSLAMLERYRQRDERVKVIALKENGGAGNARNVGIEAARGEYLAFVDADDTIAPDFLELLYKKARESGADIIKGACLDTAGNMSESELNLRRMRLENQRIKGLMEQGKALYRVFFSRHFSAIYRRSFIIENGIRYGTSAVGEDSTFLLKVGVYARSFELEPEAVYRYCLNETSLSNTFSQKRLDGIISSIKEQFAFLESADTDRRSAAKYAAERIAWALLMQSYLTTLENCEIDAENFKKRIFELVCGCSFAERMGEANYSVGVFLRSLGEENVSALGPIPRHDTEAQTLIIKRLSEHLAASPFRRESGSRYLEACIGYIFLYPPITETMSFDEYKAVTVKRMHKALTRLNAPKTLSRMNICLRALVEYGRNVFSTHRFADDEEKLDALVGAFEQVLIILQEHPDAAPEYLALADSYARLIAELASSAFKTQPERASKLIALSMSSFEKLDRIREKRMRTNGDKDDEA